MLDRIGRAKYGLTIESCGEEEKRKEKVPGRNQDKRKKSFLPRRTGTLSIAMTKRKIDQRSAATLPGHVFRPPRRSCAPIDVSCAIFVFLIVMKSKSHIRKSSRSKQPTNNNFTADFINKRIGTDQFARKGKTRRRCDTVGEARGGRKY